MRGILGQYLGCAPERLVFAYGAYGKPYLVFPKVELTFNLAHSADLAICAVTCDQRIGIDIEQVRIVPDALEIARDLPLNEHRDSLAHLGEPIRSLAFLRLWCAYEAQLKAEGNGLAGTRWLGRGREAGDGHMENARHCTQCN